MGSAAQAVVDALADLATPRRALCDQMEELERRRCGWRDALVGDLWLVDDENVRFDYGAGETTSTLRDGLDDALAAFVDGSGPDMTTIPTRVLRTETGEIVDVASSLPNYRIIIDEDLAEVRRGLADAGARLKEAFCPVRDRLSDWVDDLTTEGNATEAEWGRIQKAWRTSLTLPMRLAGALLDVSSAAIARYETGARTPSLRSLTDMVHRIVELGPTAGLDVALVIHAVSVLFAEDAFVHIDKDEGPALLASIEDRLQTVTIQQLRFIDALIADGRALDQFIAWTAATPTHLLRAVSIAAATP